MKNWAIGLFFTIVLLGMFLYYNPQIAGKFYSVISSLSYDSIKKITTTTTVRPSVETQTGCPTDAYVKNIINSSVRLTAEYYPNEWSSNSFRIPYKILWDIPDYKFGSAVSLLSGKYSCNFYPGESWQEDYFKFICRKGEEEGENINYLYCYTGGYYGNFLMGKDYITPDGTIEKKIRSVVTKLTIDPRTFEAVELKCENIECL